jgi:hypothetical protein
MIQEAYKKYAVVAAGGTVTIPVTTPISYIELYTAEAVTLLGNAAIASSGTPKSGTTIWVKSNLTNLSLDSFSFTLFGEPITKEVLENTMFLAKCTYSETAVKWLVNVMPDFEGTGFIKGTHLVNGTVDTTQIADDAITLAKLDDIARGSILLGGDSNTPSVRDFKTSGNIPIGNGTDVLSVPVSGDITISASGVTTIGAGVVEESMLAFSLASYLEVTRTLTSAEILALYSANTNSGYEFIAAPGSNKYIEIISASAMINYGTTTYNAGTDLLEIDINLVPLWSFPNSFFEATGDTINQGTRNDSVAIAVNTAAKLHCSTTNPTTGDSTITVKAIYRICDFI